MKYLQRSMCALILFALVMGLTPLLAQDTAVKATGSGIVLPLVEELATASGTGITVDVTTTGTAAGFQALCSGEAALVGATRTISIEEEAACKSAGITFMELLIAHDIVTFVGNPADEFLSCLTSPDLDNLFTPASAGRIVTWNQVKDTFPSETPLKVLVPAADSLEYELLDNLVKGDGIRSDAVSGDAATIIQTVTAEPGTIGVVDWMSAQNAAGSVKIVNINTAGGCTPPDATTVEDGTYGAAVSLYVYVNTAQAATIQPLLDYVGSDASQTTVIAAGLAAPSFTALESNRQIVAGQLTGRVYSREEVEFQVPANLAGQVNVAGSGALFDYIKGVADSMTGGANQQAQQAQANFAVNFNMEGEAAGVRRLCNGEVDLISLTAPMNGDQIAACEANNIELITLPMGTQAVVLVGHEGDTVTDCLTRDQLIKIWGAPSAGVNNWQDVGEGLPDLPMTLFGLPAGNPLADILLENPGNPTLPVRQDTALLDDDSAQAQIADPLYRAAAVANVEGALTYMGWSDYVRVLANNQTRIQIVAVDGSNGCVEPSADTIADGTYPLIQSNYLVISQRALARLEVQAYVWSLFLDANYISLSAQGLIGLEPGASNIRVMLQEEFDKAVAAAAQAPEATPEAESTADAEATTEAEPTAEATVDATVEPTAEATAEPTAEATAEATVEPTAEASAEPTAEATAAATAESTTEADS